MNRIATNGTLDLTGRSTRAKTKTRARVKPSRATARHRIAGGIAGVCVLTLGLSVIHCTESISLLTGSPWFLSALLAIGIDAGMILSELAELAGDEAPLRRWARSYIALSVILSMGLNGFAFAQHAAISWAGAALGVVIPTLVLVLGRVAAHLEKGGPR